MSRSPSENSPTKLVLDTVMHYSIETIPTMRITGRIE